MDRREERILEQMPEAHRIICPFCRKRNNKIKIEGGCLFCDDAGYFIGFDEKDVERRKG
jgi:hypothetical protein